MRKFVRAAGGVSNNDEGSSVMFLHEWADTLIRVDAGYWLFATDADVRDWQAATDEQVLAWEAES